LLTRVGVTRIGLIDTDAVHETSLNRLHFSTRADAILRRPKVDVLGEAIADVGLARGHACHGCADDSRTTASRAVGFFVQRRRPRSGSAM